LKKAPGVLKFFDGERIDDQSREGILGIALERILQRAQDGGGLSSAEKSALLRNASEKSILPLINHTGLADAYLFSQLRKEEDAKHR
jgi:hypothetical protein